MNQWSRSRKRIILGILVLAIIVLIGLPVFFLFYRAPTCNDLKMNGDEAGVDCGGSCQLLCSSESLPLLIKGDPRILKVATSTYEVVALVDNANSNADIYKAGYTIKLYDPLSKIPVKEIKGNTYVPKGSSFAVFEGPFTLDDKVSPKRATLEWDEDTILWRKDDKVLPSIKVVDSALSRASSTPRIESTVTNLSLENVSNIDLVALVSDPSGNVFAASKTYIDNLSAGETTEAVFTWPLAFEREVAGIEVLVRLLPDGSFIK